MTETNSPAPLDRVLAALANDSPFGAVLDVVRKLRDEGMPQAELTALYDAFRAEFPDVSDDKRHDAILDTMDFIVGWCNPAHALYPTRESRTMSTHRISIQLNGEPHETSAGISLLDLLAELGLPPQSVLVEHNDTALFRSDWPQISLADGDRLEIIRVVAGG